ncbi:MAG: phospho-N-acetylmuramoyl-pentapeptide-transferase [Clostridia bacterium]|nr:phospho-N-acetylmuramoyl-pentapeptide-transferase [Clostridia bacterium]
MKTLLLILIISFFISFVLGLFTIPLLKRLKVGQPILKYVSEHKNKSGTPTMGGIFFIIATFITCIIFNKFESKISTMCLVVIIAFALVGFIDDFVKIQSKKNEGLKPMQKLLFQIVIAIIASVYAYLSGLDFLYVPFTTDVIFLKWASIPLNVFVFLGAVNGVNLLDGLDGLSSGVTIVYFLAVAVIILIELNVNSHFYLLEGEYIAVVKLCFCIVGSLIAFLVFNSPKACVFMGDTGSLSLGGAVAVISLMTGNTLYIAIIGILYVVTVLSVIVQVLYYKRTKKRIFLMAPLHHHFQHLGYNEAKISFCYTVITFLIALIAIVFIL